MTNNRKAFTKALARTNRIYNDLIESDVRAYYFEPRYFYLWDDDHAVDLRDTKQLKSYLVQNRYIDEKEARQWYLLKSVSEYFAIRARVYDMTKIKKTKLMKRIWHNAARNRKHPMARKCAEAALRQSRSYTCYISDPSGS